MLKPKSVLPFLAICLFSSLNCVKKPIEKPFYVNDFKRSLVENTIQKTLTDNYGNNYLLTENGKSGYSIKEAKSGITIEKSSTSQSPYYGYYDDLKYYDPQNYYVKEKQNVFKHAVRQTLIEDDSYLPKLEIDDAENNTYESPIVAVSNDTTESRILKKYKTLIDIEEFDYNVNGTCGYVAAALCIWYYYYNYNFFIIGNQDYGLWDRGYTKEFHDYLVGIGASMNIGNSTTAKEIHGVLYKFGEKNWQFLKVSWQLLSDANKIDESLRGDKPVIIFGNFVSPQSGVKANHAVVVWGVHNETSGGSSRRYLDVNFGWKGYTDVTLLDSLFKNPIGSTCYIEEYY